MFDWLVDGINAYLASRSTTDLIWEAIGVGAQLLFASRWLVQWIFSERAERSIVPIQFWYISISGGVILLAYGVYHISIAIIIGQLGGLAVYTRNLVLIYKRRRIEAQDKVPIEDQVHQHE
jgi:lipid-A-disaccharide synthase-like uncharacterized protein